MLANQIHSTLRHNFLFRIFRALSYLSCMSLEDIEAPFHLHPNSWEVIEAGIESGGQELLETLAMRLGRPNLSGLHILDVGCGVRLTQTIVNRSIPVGSYTGIKVKADI